MLFSKIKSFVYYGLETILEAHKSMTSRHKYTTGGKGGSKLKHILKEILI